MNDISFGMLKLFPVKSRPYGLTYEQWSKKWWSWLLNIPIQNSPVYDETGRNAHWGQDDPNVFFLCQTYGQSNSNPTRRILIHRGKSLFMPLINWISITPEDGLTDSELISKAQSKMNSIRDLRMIVNGYEFTADLCQYRVQSKPFCVDLQKDNILALQPGPKKIVSDGYWILTESILKSLYLTTFGSCSAGLTRIGVNYDLRILE